MAENPLIIDKKIVIIERADSKMSVKVLGASKKELNVALKLFNRVLIGMNVRLIEILLVRWVRLD